MNIMQVFILKFPFGNALHVWISPIFTNIFPLKLDYIWKVKSQWWSGIQSWQSRLTFHWDENVHFLVTANKQGPNVLWIPWPPFHSLCLCTPTCLFPELSIQLYLYSSQFLITFLNTPWHFQVRNDFLSSVVKQLLVLLHGMCVTSPFRH